MKNIIKILPYILIIILCFSLLKSCENTKEMNNLYKTSIAELEIEVNEKNQEKAKIVSFESDKKNNFLKLQTKDSTILELQKLVSDYKGKLKSALVLKNSTQVIGSTKTIVKFDTIIVDGIKNVNPIYSTEWSNKWEKGKIVAKSDSIFRDIKVTNDYQLVIGKSKSKWFKRRKLKAEILNLNPNTTTKEFRSFVISEKTNRIYFGLSAGYGLTNNGLSPYFGFGLTYNLFVLK